MSELATHFGLLCVVVCSMQLHSVRGDGSDSATNLGTPYRVHVGHNVTLPCHTALVGHDVDWMYQSSQDATQQYVYSNGIVYMSFRPRFRVESPSTGDFNLIIDNVQPLDAGDYICTEDGGFGTKHTTSVVVIETTLEQTTASQNDTTTTESRTWIIIGVVVVVGVVLIMIVIVVVLVWYRCRDQGNGQKTQRHNTYETTHALLPHDNKGKDKSGHSDDIRDMESGQADNIEHQNHQNSENEQKMEEKEVSVASNKTDDRVNATTNSKPNASTEVNNNNKLSAASSSCDDGRKQSGAGDDVSTTPETQRCQRNETDVNDSKVETPDTHDAEQSEVERREPQRMSNEECDEDGEHLLHSSGPLNPCGRPVDEAIMGTDRIGSVRNVEADNSVVSGELDDQDTRTDSEDNTIAYLSRSGKTPFQIGKVSEIAGTFGTRL